MLKFRPIDPSHFKQHIVNLPKTAKARQKVLDSVLAHADTLQNLRKGHMDSTVLDIPSKVSIRTARTR